MVRRPRHDENGFVAIEFVMIMSVLIALFMLTLAYAVKAHSHRIAAAAAEQGLAAASSYDGNAAAGQSATEHYLANLGGGLTDSHVQVSRGAQTATVSVVAHAPDFIPLLPMTVHVNVSGPVERVVPPSANSAPSAGGTP